MLDSRHHWWRRSVGELIEIGLQKGVSRDDLFRTLGDVWDGRSKLRSEGSLVDASRLALYRRGVIKEIQALGELSGISADQASLRTYVLDNSFDGRALCVFSIGNAGAERDVETIVFDLDLGDFILPLAMAGDLLASYSPPRLAEEVISWVSKVHHKRAEISNVAHSLYKEFEKLELCSEGGLQPLRVHLKPKMCFKYDNWPDEVDFELIGLMLDPKLDWSIFSMDVLHGECFEFGAAFAQRCRRRTRVRTYLERTGSAGLISDLALAVGFNLGVDAGRLLDQAERPHDKHWRAKDQIDDVGPTFFVNEGVLHSRWHTPQLNFRSGLISVSGEYPISVALSAPGRSISELIDYDPFVQTEATVIRAKVCEGKLELVTDGWAIPVEDVASVPPAEALTVLRQLRKLPGHEIPDGLSGRFRWQRLPAEPSD